MLPVSPTYIHPLHATPPSYVTHFWSPEPGTFDQDIIDLNRVQMTTTLESNVFTESGTTGLRTWPASLVLAEYLILNPGSIARKRVLELGSGAGLLGTLVATVQQSHDPDHASSLWLTDINSQVLARCRSNIRLPCNASCYYPNVYDRISDWSEALEPSSSHALRTMLQEEINPDIVLGADLVYDPEIIPALVQTICLALEANGTKRDEATPEKVAYIALTVRNEATVEAFVSHAERMLWLNQLDPPFRSKRPMFLAAPEGGGASIEETMRNVRILKIQLKSDQ